MPTPLASDIAAAWRAHFWSADHDLHWIAAEVEHSVWLTPNTLLAGRIDALGENDNGPFFGEWKTANPREKNTWKQVWRMNPQSLTYGVLGRDWWQRNHNKSCYQFTVRKAFKSTPPTFDHAWYSYNDEELNHWELQLIHIANEIRQGKPGPWETNWASCFTFGINYACPHFEEGCSKMKWDVPAGTLRRQPHLDIECRLNAEVPVPGLVVLDATRVAVWLRCREKFRREYVENVATPVGEALTLGIEFHELVGNYYQELVTT
jgi:hypothetical protein